MEWIQIGVGTSIGMQKNAQGGYDAILRTNATLPSESSYVLLARTTKLVQEEYGQVWE